MLSLSITKKLKIDTMRDKQILILAKYEVKAGTMMGQPITLEDAIKKVTLKIARLEKEYEPNFL